MPSESAEERRDPRAAAGGLRSQFCGFQGLCRRGAELWRSLDCVPLVLADPISVGEEHPEMKGQGHAAVNKHLTPAEHL